MNAIDLEFQGKKFKKVIESWKTYLDHLNHYPKDDEKQQSIWQTVRVDLLSKLLLEMGKSLGFSFDEVHVKRAIYAPEVHSQQENENWLIRRGLLRVLYGDSNLKMEVTSIPIGEQIAAE